MRGLRMLAGVVLAAVLLPASAQAAAPKVLQWEDLLPAGEAAAVPQSPLPQSPLVGATTQSLGDIAAGSTLKGEDQFLGEPGEEERAPPPQLPAGVVEDLNGKQVSIGGYLVPLDFEAADVREFLLVPYVGACLHVPPPPPNQVIFVRFPKGFQTDAVFDPVTVVGKLTTVTAATELAEAGYSLDAETVEIATAAPETP